MMKTTSLALLPLRIAPLAVVLAFGVPTAFAADATKPAKPAATGPVAAPPAVAPSSATSGAVDCETAQDDKALLFCAEKDYSSAQTRLQDLVARTIKSLPAKSKPLFEAAQSAWQTYRDAECAWNATDVENGATTEVVRMTCLADLTAGRVEELEAGLGAP